MLPAPAATVPAAAPNASPVRVHCAWIAEFGASTRAGSPSRRRISNPSSVLPDPGGATRCVECVPARRGRARTRRARATGSGARCRESAGRRARSRAHHRRCAYGSAVSSSSTAPKARSTASPIASPNTAISASPASGRSRSSASRTSGQRSGGRPAASNGRQTCVEEELHEQRRDGVGVLAQLLDDVERDLRPGAERRQLGAGAREPRARILEAALAQRAQQARAPPRARAGRRDRPRRTAARARRRRSPRASRRRTARARRA